MSGTVRMVERDPWGLHVWLPAEECPACDEVLDRLTSGRGDVVVEADCGVHACSVRLSNPGRSRVATLRLARESAHSAASYVRAPLFEDLSSMLVPHLSTMRTSGPTWRKCWDVLGDPSAFGVDPQGGDETALMAELAWHTDVEPEEDKRAWRAAGVDRPFLMKAWALNKYTPESARPWLRAGVTHPNVASAWAGAGYAPSEVPAGFDGPAGVGFAEEFGLPVTPEWGHLLRNCTGDFARAGFDQGRTAEEVAALADAITARTPDVDLGVSRGEFKGVVVFIPWSVEVSREATTAAARLDGLDWADVALCVRAGLSLSEAAALLRTDRDLSRVRVMEAIVGPNPPEGGLW